MIKSIKKSGNNGVYMPDKRERRNITVFLIFTVISGIAGNILSEGYIQAYLIKLGFDTEGIRNYGITVQTVSIFAYMIFTRLHTGKRTLKKIYAAAILLAGIFPLVLAAAGYIPSFTVIYIAILSAAALYSFLASYRVTAEFSMIPHLFSRNLYGIVTSKAMIISGLITAGISGLTGFLSGYGDSRVYAFLFAVPMFALVISAFLVLLYKFGNGESDNPIILITYSNIIKKVVSARYIKILLPHFLRGAAMAGIYYIIPSVLENIKLSDKETSYIIVISVLSTMTGSFIFMRLNHKIKSGMVTLISIFVCSSTMPLLVMCANKYIFFVLYFIFFIFNIISSISIPTGVLRSTPDDELSLITSMRFVLMGAASVLFIFVFGVLLEYIAPVYIMFFSGAVFILCGFFCNKQFDDKL